MKNSTNNKMASAIYNYVQNLLPFSTKYDDLKESEKIVKKLSVPNHTKEFIFAIKEPETQSLIYILCVQNLSERSCIDTECLVREIKPDCVVVQVGNGFEEERFGEEKKNGFFDVPTTWFGVLKRCFVEKISREEYEGVAGNLVMREIFGVGIYGHFESAKKVAKEVGSSFLLLESPFAKNSGVNSGEEDKYGSSFSKNLSGNSVDDRFIKNLSDGGEEEKNESFGKNERDSSNGGVFACQQSNLVSEKGVGSFGGNSGEQEKNESSSGKNSRNSGEEEKYAYRFSNNSSNSRQEEKNESRFSKNSRNSSVEEKNESRFSKNSSNSGEEENHESRFTRNSSNNGENSGEEEKHESWFSKNSIGSEEEEKNVWGRRGFGVFACKPSNLVSQKVVSSFGGNSRKLLLLNDSNLKAVRLFSSQLKKSMPIGSSSGQGILPMEDYEAPAFAQPIYSLLLDLHNIFVDIPSMGSALAHAQRMLNDVSKGESVDGKLISEVYAFQISVEGLRIALNNAGRVPISKMGSPNANKPYAELREEEKKHVLVAQALKSQAKQFRSIVAVMDASSLAGLRRYWATSVPTEYKGILEDLIIDCNGDDPSSSYNERKRLLTSKPVVAVGAGATAIIGASSLSKAIPASTVVKVMTYKIPTSLKLLLSQTQKAVALMTKVGPSNVLSPGVKAAASAEKIRVVAHSVIASVEKTSISAMRTAFYEIMRKRSVRRIGVLPWVTFGCSIATCSGLLMYGDGIECVAESVPSAPSIASLGRGVQNLQMASQSVRQAESSRIRGAIDALMYRFKNAKTK